MGYLQAQKDHFEVDGKPIVLRGWALGSWMNMEHFMVGMPGTNTEIIDAFVDVYGQEKAEEFFDHFIDNMIGEDDIVFLKNIGINSIRIPFGYHHFFDDAKPYEFKESGFEKLDKIVQLCAKHQLFVILDLHSTPGSQNTDWHSDNSTGFALFWTYRIFQDQVIWLWEELAKRYADNQWIAGYDVINEPGYGVSGEAINGFYDRVLNVIRKHDPYHILFLEGTDFGRDFSVLEKVEDPNVAYTVHFYPFVLEENVLDPALDDERRLQIFTQIYDRQLSAVARLGHPVWCGESGYEILDGQESFYAKLLLHNIRLSEERGISWNLWTYKDARCMGIVIPKVSSPWMQMFYKIAEKWSHHKEERISMEVTTNIGKQYYQPLSNTQAYDLDFRIRTVLHTIAVEQILKSYLQCVPWEIMKGYTDSLLFENCDQRTTVVNAIKDYIKTKEDLESC